MRRSLFIYGKSLLVNKSAALAKSFSPLQRPRRYESTVGLRLHSPFGQPYCRIAPARTSLKPQ